MLVSPEQLAQLAAPYTAFQDWRQATGYEPSYTFGGTDKGMTALPTPYGLSRGLTELAVPDDPTQTDLWKDPNFQKDWQLWQLQSALSYGGSQADDSFQGFVANVFGNSYTLPALFAGGAIGAGSGGDLAVQAGTTGVNLTQNPSGSGVGGALASLAGSAAGIPGLGLAGSLAGGAAQGALSGDGDGGDSGDGGLGSPGGQGMATDWGTLLAQLVGLGGAGLGLAGAAQTAGRQDTVYGQQQQLYQLLLSLANQQQQQRQTTYGQEQGLYQQLLNLANQQQGRLDTQYGQQQAAYPQQVSQVLQDIANRQQTFGQRQGIGARLSDPSQVLAGANTMFQGLQGRTQDEVLRGLQRDLAMRGQSNGGAGMDATATVLARMQPQLYQQAMQNYLTSQGQALGAYSYPPAGPYSPNPPTPPGIAGYPNVPQPPGLGQYPSQFPQVPGSATSSADALRQIGSILGGVGGGPGLVQALTRLLGNTGGGGDTTTAGALGGSYGGESPYGSDIPGMTTGYNPTGSTDYFSNLYSGSGLGGESLDTSYLDVLTL